MAKGTVNVGPAKSQSLDDYLKKTGDGSDVTASFTAASTRANISTGEKLSVIFGKLAKWFADLKTVAFTGSYNDLSDKPTIPSGVTVDSALSSTSTNPVQNKVVNSALSGKAASSHTHAATDIASGTLAVARGGTGVTSNPSMLTNLGSTSAASVFASSPRPGVTGTLPIANGGTGATTAAAALTALGAAASSHTHAASAVTAGTFAGQVVANSSGQTYSTYCLRNTRLASSDTNPTVNGQICWTYG